MCWWCQPQLHTDAARAFIKDDMTHLLLIHQYYTPPSFRSHKDRSVAVSKGVHSYHFSNANREPRNTSLLLFDVNNRNTHSNTLTQMGTQPCFSYYSTACTGRIFFTLTHICFFSVLAGYLGWLTLITPLTERGIQSLERIGVTGGSHA